MELFTVKYTCTLTGNLKESNELQKCFSVYIFGYRITILIQLILLQVYSVISIEIINNTRGGILIQSKKGNAPIGGQIC